MRLATTLAAAALALVCAAAPAFAECDDKSQQNAADEAQIHGDHEAASKCATPGDVKRAQKKMEDAAVAAQRNTGKAQNATEGKSDKR